MSRSTPVVAGGIVHELLIASVVASMATIASDRFCVGSVWVPVLT